MLNEVHLEGIVTRGGWTYEGACFVRLAIYRDTDLPRKLRATEARQDEADYVSLRCEGPFALAAGALRVGGLVRVRGVLVTRDYEIPLVRFAAEARGPAKARPSTTALAELKTVSASHGRELCLPHTLTEVLVNRLIVLAPPPMDTALALEQDRRRRPRTAARIAEAAAEAATAAAAGQPVQTTPQPATGPTPEVDSWETPAPVPQ